MSHKTPEITVLMAVYNGAQTLQRAMDSILTQTFGDFEFLIIDDCSTDDTVDLIMSRKDERIRLHRNDKNVGQTMSLNIGLAISNAKYIARMDVDDLSLPQRLEKQLRFINGHPEYAVVGTDCLVVDENNNKRTVSRGCVSQEEIVLRMLYGSPINHVSVLMRKDAVNSVNGYKPEYVIGADFDLWSRLLRAGHKMTTIPEILMMYTFSDNSYSYRNKGVKNEEVARIVYDNVKSLSNYKADEKDVCQMMRIFYEPLMEMTNDDIIRSQNLFKNIVSNVKPEFSASLRKEYVRKILSRNYWVAAYHLILDEKSRQARQLARRCLINNGFDFYSTAIYLLAFLGSDMIKKMNYLRSKYLL